jgi:hypothetical protein
MGYGMEILKQYNLFLPQRPREDTKVTKKYYLFFNWPFRNLLSGLDGEIPSKISLAKAPSRKEIII